MVRFKGKDRRKSEKVKRKSTFKRKKKIKMIKMTIKIKSLFGIG